MDTGLKLKLKRVEKKIKAKQIASALNVSDSYISHMENGNKPIPDTLLIKWQNFLDNVL